MAEELYDIYEISYPTLPWKDIYIKGKLWRILEDEDD
jgi:hypothetical protein